VNWRKNGSCIYVPFLDLSLVRKKEFRERGGGTREKKSGKKREKKHTFSKGKSVKKL